MLRLLVPPPPLAPLPLTLLPPPPLPPLPASADEAVRIALSDNPDLIGRPTDFNITVREIEIAAGAGFLVPITGEMMRMPGLPPVPAAEAIDITDDGEISGLF